MVKGHEHHRAGLATLPQSLEEALEYIAADELVEITPNNIRLRKKMLSEVERKRASRKKTDD